VVAPDSLIPPLSTIDRLPSQGIRNILVKLSPAIDRNIGEQNNGSLRFVSDKGECKEALLGLGALKGPHDISAVVVPDGIVTTGAGIAPVRQSFGSFMYEADPAVIRAGLVAVVAEQVNGWLADSDIAYVFSDRKMNSPIATRYSILEARPFHLAHLKQSLRALNCGKVIVKKRGVEIEPEALVKSLSGDGDRDLVVVVTRTGKRRWAIIAAHDDGNR
jgi:hypothetical protein